MQEYTLAAFIDERLESGGSAKAYAHMLTVEAERLNGAMWENTRSLRRDELRAFLHGMLAGGTSFEQLLSEMAAQVDRLATLANPEDAWAPRPLIAIKPPAAQTDLSDAEGLAGAEGTGGNADGK